MELSGRSSPPSTSARFPLRPGGIKSRFAVGRASGRDDQRFPPLHRPIERLGGQPPRRTRGAPPAPLLSGLSGAEGGGCPPPQGLLGFGGGGDVPPLPSGAGSVVWGSGSGVWFGVWVWEGRSELQQGGQRAPPSAHSPSLPFACSRDSAMYPLGRGVCGCELWEQETNIRLV